MPPVREASTKPMAATVLPAPVACSNQKRLCGVGILGGALRDVLVDVLGRLVELLEGHRLEASSSSSPPRALEVGSGRLAPASASSASGSSSTGEHRRSGTCRPVAARPSARAARSACPRARRPGGVERRAVDQPRLVLAEQALEPEQQRVAPAPLRRGDGPALLDLAQRGVQRAPARRAGRQRVGRGLARVDEALQREALGALDRRRIGNRCGSTTADVVQPSMAFDVEGGAAEGTASRDSGPRARPPERPRREDLRGSLAPARRSPPG